ncbi:MAG: hypothetical protein JXB32_07785 [Deltaproteobacteria bacterium]|nr:hypothetical protein [Deltaproteobacteria bacterium]
MRRAGIGLGLAIATGTWLAAACGDDGGGRTDIGSDGDPGDGDGGVDDTPTDGADADGDAVEPPPNAALDPVYLVSDDDWRTALELVPVAAAWGTVEGFPERYLRPLLVFHVEPGGAFDVDAAVRFFELAGPREAVLVGEAPAQAVEALEWGAGSPLRRVAPSALWTEVPDVRLTLDRPGELRHVVLVEDDYGLALGAAVLASLENRLLVIRGGALDRPESFAGRSAQLVGAGACPDGATCDETLATAQDVRLAALERLGPDAAAVVLASHADLEDGVAPEGGYAALEYGPPLTTIGGKFSLAAPYLAAARRELLVTTGFADAKAIDAELETMLRELGVLPRYLTIVAAPTAIPMALLRPDAPGELWGYHYELDMTVYASDGLGVPSGLGFWDNDQFADAAAGRILGVTVTDVSAYLARELFAELGDEIDLDLRDGRTGKAALDDDGGVDHIHVHDRLAEVFAASGWETAYNGTGTLREDDYEAAALIGFAGHGFEEGTAGFLTTERLRSIRDVFPAFVYLSACLTCNYQAVSAAELFCSHLIRFGATGVITAVGYGNDENKFHHWVGVLLDRKKIGDAFRDMRMEWHDTWYYDDMNPLLLIGDPLYRPRLDDVDASFFPTSTVTAAETAGGRRVEIVVEQPLDPARTYLMRPPLMPSTEAADSGLFGVPRLHLQFDGLDPNEEPSSLRLTWDLGDGAWVLTAASSCRRERAASGLLDYERVVCVPSSVEVCRATAGCTSGASGSVDGATVAIGAILVDHAEDGRRYTLTATTFHFEPGSPLAEELAAAGPVPVRIELLLGHQPYVP